LKIGESRPWLIGPVRVLLAAEGLAVLERGVVVLVGAVAGTPVGLGRKLKMVFKKSMGLHHWQCRDSGAQY
jgi:hypothetical protein